jgi:hypothetical protein
VANSQHTAHRGIPGSGVCQQSHIESITTRALPSRPKTLDPKPLTLNPKP